MTDIKVVTCETQVSAYNRAIQFGDAHFTTLKISNHKIEHWSLHLERLLNANQRLGFGLFPDAQISQSVQHIANNHAHARVKILVTRGQSQQGYLIPDDLQVQTYLYVTPLTAQQKPLKPVSLSFLTTRLAEQPLLAGLKHCNRLEQVLIKQELQQKGFEDGLVFSYQDHLIETSLANIFVMINGQWTTPSLHLCGVAGVIRRFILTRRSDVCIRPVLKSELANVEAAIITNAIIGMRPVERLNARPLSIQRAQQFCESIYA